MIYLVLLHARIPLRQKQKIDQVNLHHNERSEWRGKYIFYLLQDWKYKILPCAMHHAPCMAPLYGKGVPPLPGLRSQPPPGLVNLWQAIILFCHLDIFYL